jgi:hypothetical protein
MRLGLCLAQVAMLVSAGCSHPGHTVAQAGAPATGVTEPSPPGGEKLVVTLQTGLEGKVASVNGRYVVLNFPVGSLPALEQKLYVYHLGLKTAELRVSGPQLDDTIVADVISGQVSMGDRVSAK